AASDWRRRGRPASSRSPRASGSRFSKSFPGSATWPPTPCAGADPFPLVMTRKPDAAVPTGPASAASPPPAPRFALGWAALVHAVCTLALGFPALAGKFLVNPYSDQYIAGYAFREFARSHF